MNRRAMLPRSDGFLSEASGFIRRSSDKMLHRGFFPLLLLAISTHAVADDPIPMSLGNFVWVDANNNGLYESASESPVDDGVIMSLYGSNGTTPVDDPANPSTPYQVTTSNGFYLFEGLPEGDYVVRLDLLNFLPGGALEGFLGSNNAGAGYEDDSDTDMNDNGRDVVPFDSGIPSGVITLAYTTEPTGEETSGNSADGPNGRGNNGETDNNSNLSVDFGVYLVADGYARLTLSKTPDSGTIQAGDDIAFAIEVENDGPDTAKAVSLMDTLPAGSLGGFTVSGTDAGDCESPIVANTLNCDFGDMASGASKSITVTAGTDLDHCATYDSVATASSLNAPNANDSGLVNCEISITTIDKPLPGGGSGLISFATLDGECVFESASFIDASAISPAPPEEIEFPMGLATFIVSGCANGARIDVILDFGVDLPLSSTVWKSDPWRELADATISDSLIIYTVTDGGPNDADGTANGVIVDPAGPARLRSVSRSTPVPVFPLWALAMLMALVGYFGTGQLRKH